MLRSGGSYICKMASLPAGTDSSSPARLLSFKFGVTVDNFIFLRIGRQWIHLFLLLLLVAAFPARSFSGDVSYADHCGSIVSASAPSALRGDAGVAFRLSSGYFVGGDRFLGQDSSADFSIPRSFTFYSRSVLNTQTPGTLQVVGTLIFRGGGIHFTRRNLTVRGRSLRLVRPWNPRSFNQRGRLSFDLSGFWSEQTGTLCMVGPGTGRSKEGFSLNLSAVFKLKYPSTSNITSSVVSGILESLESVNSPNFFAPITVLSYAQRNYEYTQVSHSHNSCSNLHDAGDQSMDFLDGHQSICDSSGNLLRTRLKLDYGSHGCSERNCNPLSSISNFQPESLRITSLNCADDGRSIRAVILFSNYTSFSSMMMLEPGRSMVAEGSWDHTKKQFCLIACPIKPITKALTDETVDECSIGLTLAFPTVLSIESRSSTIGRIWSNLNESSPKHFIPVNFHSFADSREYDQNLRYKYTKMDAVKKFCIDSDAAHKSGKNQYPNPKNYEDFMFYLLIRTSDGKLGSGFANPVALGETIYHYNSPDHPSLAVKDEITWNMSYTFRHSYNLNSPFNSPDAEEISAEGIYDSRTGMICMIGCKSSKDCSVLINIQIPPINSELGEMNGTIRSTRAKSDPLFFEPLEISSHVMYSGQAAQSIWMMDVEITMVIISLTFSCIFVGLQLLHINKNPSVLPSISITMLVIMTMGHMIILVLNFEAFLRNHKKQNFMEGDGGWLEVNEVVVRLMTMAAFLFHFRLLQVAWSARSTNEGKASLWVAERKTILFCLFLYIVGGLIAWFVHLKPRKVLHHVPHLFEDTYDSRWDDLQSYAGLILDGFLCPQVVLNVLRDSKERALAPPFYIGATILRALPHVYDAYRSRHSTPHLDSSFIYAKPNGDLYSLAWDIIIPCGGFLFAVVIFVQQRFSGASILCRRIKSAHGQYEMVPVSGS